VAGVEPDADEMLAGMRATTRTVASPATLVLTCLLGDFITIRLLCARFENVQGVYAVCRSASTLTSDD